MALFTPGQVCNLCGNPMEKRKDVIVFPHMVNNINEPLYFFNGGVFHKSCVYTHPMGKIAIRQKQFVQENLVPGANRWCTFCDGKISDPNQLIATGILTLDENHPLYEYNWLEAHKRCIPHWDGLPKLVNELEKYVAEKNWKDIHPEFRAMQRLINTLKPLIPGRAETAMLY